jgi:hypothetical protein
VLQAGTQAAPSQVTVPFAGAAQIRHRLPQDMTLVLPLTTQAPPHA